MQLIIIVLLTMLTLLSGCATVGGSNGEIKIIGRIEKIEKTTRLYDPPIYLNAFGLIGALVSLSSVREVPTNQYVVHSEQGAIKTILTDSEFQIGDCVEIIIPHKAESQNDFRYGEAEIESSEKCASK